MSNSKPNTGSCAKRNLPSWMSGKNDGSDSRGKKIISSGGKEVVVEAEEPKQGKANGEGPTSSTNSMEIKNTNSLSAVGSCHRDFSKILEGVVFVLSGFVNPERSILRSRALEMGADYKPDWNSDCTLLVCAFPNTPKFRQVESDCGTIVSKEWISECYTQKKLIEIDSYLLHAGKPWRRSDLSHETSQVADEIVPPSTKPQKQVERVLHLKPNEEAISQGRDVNSSRDYFSPLKLKKWAIDDLHKTISWLENQDEKPDPDEIKKIAAEGILTCLQDAIDSLEKNQDINEMIVQWKFIPQVVEKLADLRSKKNSISKDELCKHAKDSKRMYEIEYSFLCGDSPERKKKPKIKKEREKDHREMNEDGDASECDSGETIEMTEEEIDLAFQTLASNKRT